MHSKESLNEKNNLAEQSYWDSSYASHKFEIVPQNDVIRQWIEKYIPDTKTGSCLEIGAFPGRYLAVFGELGYELNGIDLTPRIHSDLPAWLAERGYRIGNFLQTDFFKFNPGKKFDVVSSFGFIEHFKNWEEVFRIHARLVERNGYLIIETPNFRGFIQKTIHSLLDKENLNRHYLPSMNPVKWKQIAEAEGFEIIHCNYIGEFDFWVNDVPESFGGKILFRFFSRTKSIVSFFSGKISSSSPYIGIIAKRKS